MTVSIVAALYPLVKELTIERLPLFVQSSAPKPFQQIQRDHQWSVLPSMSASMQPLDRRAHLPFLFLIPSTSRHRYPALRRVLVGYPTSEYPRRHPPDRDRVGRLQGSARSLERTRLHAQGGSPEPIGHAGREGGKDGSVGEDAQ